MKKAHAILSPSGASRWMACPPSARLEEQFPESRSEYAAEGTLAHKIGELMIAEKLGRIAKGKLKSELQCLSTDKHYSDSMLEYCDDYASYVVEQYANAQKHTPDARIFLEQPLDLSDYVPEGFGTGDVVIIADGVLDLTDLKYGKGVPVSAEDNKQLMLYALGALKEFEYLYDITTVRITIYQPRINNISSWDISVADLTVWADNILRPLAAMAFDGKGEYMPGEHCMFCRAKAKCKAFADRNMELARYEFEDPDLLTDDEIADILSRINLFSTWVNSIEEYTLARAIEGKKWEGFKLVEGRSNRKYLDETAVASKLLAKGVDEETIYTKKLLGITAMEKELGKKQFETLLSDLVVKPPGKPVLVSISDKRPELNSCVSAEQDFRHVETD